MIQIFTSVPTHPEVVAKYDYVIHLDSEFGCVEGVVKVGTPLLLIEDGELPTASQLLLPREVAIITPRKATRAQVCDLLWQIEKLLPVPKEDVLLITDCYSDYERCDCVFADETQGDEIALNGPFDRVVIDTHMAACIENLDVCPIANNLAHRIFSTTH